MQYDILGEIDVEMVYKDYGIHIVFYYRIPIVRSHEWVVLQGLWTE